ncbi:MAG TPA: DUF885 domain-containing protein [Pyrinomonadaceae bacterium]|jgi:uncharacterized protein (DUF885 family)|nr:DUF885 domain-containing protein [Pyrinomonadaceae bacterium]
MDFLLKPFGSSEHRQTGSGAGRVKNRFYAGSLAALGLALCLTANLFAAAIPGADLEARRKQLNDLLAEQWEYVLRTNPEFASILGDKRFNDQVSDFSQKAIDEDLAKTREFLPRFEAIDTTGFPEQEALNKTLMVRQLKETLENARFKGWEMPVNQISGIHLQAPQLAMYLSFATVKDYDDYITRLKKFPTLMDQNIVQMRKGLADGLMPPKFLLEKVVTQAEGIGGQQPDKSPFAQPLAKFPKDISEADRRRITESLTAAIRDQVNPAYLNFAKFVKEEYAPKGRMEPGIWALPDGAARYAAAVKSSTTTDLTPEQIHQIGLSEVARIEKEMMVIANRLDFKDLKTFNAAIEKDPKLHPQSREQILEIYRKYIEGMKREMPKLFGRLPKAGFEVRQTEAFREAEASGAEYNQGTPDGSRPGYITVNTSNPTSRKTISMESTAYHEGIPGHHLQISIQQELAALPPFRQQGGNTAFVEGWALYSERLGKDVGFYTDPYSDYGRLQDEMLRAIRLVVDTGFHYKRWTRDQVVQFFHDHSAVDEVEVQSETNRYISWPAQALGYKIGQLKILELRERSKKELGDKFDIRQFHDEVLGAGSLPMDVLEARINAWIAAKKQARAE